MDWGELLFAGIFGGVSAAGTHWVYSWLIKRAHQTMGIAAGPRVTELTKQRGHTLLLVAIVIPSVVGGISVSSRIAGKPVAWQDYASEQGAYAAQFPGLTHETQQTVNGPDGIPVNVRVAEADLGSKGHYAILEREGPALTYEANDRTMLSEVDSVMMTAVKAYTDESKSPYPPAWGEVACTELRGHLNQDSDHDVVVRSWRTGQHQYSAIASYRKGDPEKVAAKFLDSIHPIGDYKRPRPMNESGVE